MVAHFDGSAHARNPNQPPKLVTWGHSVKDEMCDGFIAVVKKNQDLVRHPGIDELHELFAKQKMRECAKNDGPATPLKRAERRPPQGTRFAKSDRDGSGPTVHGRDKAMRFHDVRLAIGRHPVVVIAAWCVAAAAVALGAPSLTRLAAEGQANLLPKDAESVRVAQVVAHAWPDQAYQSMAVVALHRPEGLTEPDRAYARRLAEQFLAAEHPRGVLRVLGPTSQAAIASRMLSRDQTMQLVAVPLDTSFVSPSARRAVDWLRARAATVEGARPAGLQTLWTGDAVIGANYMDDVQRSLNRAAVATVVLLLVVLLVVYRSILLALVPLATIGVSLVIARGVLAWLAEAGWAVSPLVELFLVVILFGSGTDFCLFLTWRFDEHWQGVDPPGTMAATLRNAGVALLTSAATVIAGLSLMGTTRFKLFSSTGPSVALGLALTLAASLSLTPALLVLLARHHPRSFQGMKGETAGSGFWDRISHRAARAKPAVDLARHARPDGAGGRDRVADQIHPGHTDRDARADGLGASFAGRRREVWRRLPRPLDCGRAVGDRGGRPAGFGRAGDD